MRRLTLPTSWLALVLTSPACHGGPEPGLFGRSPSDVVKAVYGLANQGRYSETEKYFSSQLRTLLTIENLKDVWDGTTKGGTLQRVEIVSEEIRGEGATLQLRLHFKDGSTQPDNMDLLKENGEWKLSPESPERVENRRRMEDAVKLASVKTDVRNMMTAQEAYFSDYATYAADFAALQTKTNASLSSGNSASVAGVASGWTATVNNSSITAGFTQCTVQVGAGAASTVDGVITCR